MVRTTLKLILSLFLVSCSGSLDKETADQCNNQSIENWNNLINEVSDGKIGLYDGKEILVLSVLSCDDSLDLLINKNDRIIDSYVVFVEKYERTVEDFIKLHGLDSLSYSIDSNFILLKNQMVPYTPFYLNYSEKKFSCGNL